MIIYKTLVYLVDEIVNVGHDPLLPFLKSQSFPVMRAMEALKQSELRSRSPNCCLTKS